jgi:hypothetical protein
MLANLEHQRIAGKLADGDLPPGEPLFTLRARDRFAAQVVRHWCDLAEAGGSPHEKIDEARLLANDMDRWPIKQIPGRHDTRRDDGMAARERAFRDQLATNREETIRELMAIKVDEWLESEGTSEVARVLSNWLIDGLDFRNDDTIVEMAHGRLWGIE